MKRTFFFGLALCFCLALNAQMESHLTYRRYTTQDGLPQMQTEKLWQDSRGYIYIGTLSGFVRFDGQTFKPFLKGRRENIVGFVEVGKSDTRTDQSGEVRALGFRRQWCVSFDDIEMRPIDPQGCWQLNNLNSGSLPDGYVILENEQEQQRRLCRVTKQGFIPQLKGSLLDAMTPDRKLYIDSLCTLIPTESGLYRVKRGSRKAIRLTGRSDIYTLLRTDSALLVFASDGIYTVKERKMERLMTADWTEASFGLTVRKLRAGGLVIADEHTVYLYDGTGIREVVTGINLIRDMFVDRWDRLWVATYQGVYCFFNRCFTNHKLTDENDIVRAVVADGNDQLVMGTLNGKVLVRTPSSAISVISDDVSQYYGTGAVAIGNQAFLTSRGDVACVQDGILHQLGLPQDRYRFVTKENDKLVLVSQKCVIATYAPQTRQIDTLTTEIPYPWCAAFDNEGRLWAGSTLGVYSLSREGKVEKAEYPQKLLVTTMEADSQGTIFFASADSLFMIQQGKVREMSSQLPQLAGHEVRSLHVSPHGYLAVAAIDGLFVCRIAKDYQLADARFYDHRNGFTMLEPQMAPMGEASDGTIWLPGVEEMTSFRPADLLAFNEEDTYISEPLRWWQHWWVILIGVMLFALAVWGVARWYEKIRSRRKMIRLQQEKLQKEQQIETIRQKAIEAESTELSREIVKMTEDTSDRRMTFRTASGTIVVDIADIAYFKGEGNYSQIVTFHTKDIVLTGLGGLERMLSKETFVRADRSTLVNIHNVCQLLPKQRRCVFRSAKGQEVETTLLAPAFKRLQVLLP